MSDKKINGLHPYLAYLARKLKKEMKARHGIEILVYEGYRSINKQNKLYSYGRSHPTMKNKVTNARGGYSYHNFYLAFDACPLNSRGKCDWSNIDAFNKMGAIGEELGLTWGGSFRSISDKPHFEWSDGMTTKDLRSGLYPFNPLENALRLDVNGKIEYVFQKELINGSNYVHLRELLSKLGYTVEFDSLSNTVVLYKEESE